MPKDSVLRLQIKDNQLLLLKSALLPPTQAISYWTQWKNFHELNKPKKDSLFNNLDNESQRILPLVYRNLEYSKDNLLPQLKEVYLKTWLRNQIHLQNAQMVIKTCKAASIETILLKGLPVSLYYYKDFGVRPMGDVDLLIPFHQIPQAVKVLETLNYIPDPVEYKYRHLIHAMHCFDKNGVDIDIHWQAFFFQNAKAESIQDNSENSIEIKVLNTETRMLSNSLNLFHTIIHGTMGGVPTLRWIPDAIYICKQMTKEDIVDFVDICNRFNLAYAVRICMEYLQCEFGIMDEKDFKIIKDIPENQAQEKFLLLSLRYSPNKLNRLKRLIIRQSIAYDLFFEFKSSQSKLSWIIDKILFRIRYEIRTF